MFVVQYPSQKLLRIMNNLNGYKYFDEAFLHETMGGSKEEIAMIISIFFDAIPGYLTDLQAAKNAGDYSQLAFNAHKLKGTYRFVGATSLGDMALQLEQMSKASASMKEINTLVENMVITTDGLCNELKQFINS